jgi:hypothetical protein
MKNLILFLMFFGHISCIYSQSTKTLVKSFRSETNNIELLFDCNKEFVYWDNEHVKIVAEINIDKSDAILETLIKLGRYSLEKEEHSDVMFITIPKLKNDIFVKGNLISENLNLIIYLPSHMSYTNEKISM